ncbi:hypothetical protein RHAB21_00705 [Pseudorhizobium halotolerans]|uniref:Exonuclease SbcC n=1 Tax=Pseudorhizobium halotolerans TaxID=1233081 RepID=A0ABM8PYU5_9HYPH|nr:hypothetical protein [Pseudorhizobium halotolerans]CAD7055373.1 hypothetical protein RHAB21_00705 [Pseudorhizobium halotolerans]
MTAWLSKAVTPLIVISLMLLAAAFLGWLALHTVDGMVDDARLSAIAERDAHWKGEIAEANTKAALAEAAQANSALRIQAEATAKIRAAEEKLTELEKENAALPDGAACGLDHGRVRLLAR